MKYFNKILNNCEEVSMHYATEKKTNWIKRSEYKIHLIFCKCCQNYYKQTLKIEKDLLTIKNKIDQNKSIIASDEFKNELISSIQKKLNQK